MMLGFTFYIRWICLTLVGFGFSVQIGAQNFKLCTVDVDSVLHQTEIYSAFERKVEEFGHKLSAKINLKPDCFPQRFTHGCTDDPLQIQIWKEEFSRLEREEEKMIQDAEWEYTQFRDSLAADLRKEVLSAVNIVAQTEGCALVVQVSAVLYGDKGFNLSSQVLQALDGEKKAVFRESPDLFQDSSR